MSRGLTGLGTSALPLPRRLTKVGKLFNLAESQMPLCKGMLLIST